MKKQISSAHKLFHGADYNPDQWLAYPEILKEDIEMMKASHSNAFSIGMFSWATLEPEEGRFEFEWLDEIMDNINEIGGHALLATPSGARPAWMSQKYPEVLRTDSQRRKMLHGGRHNHCFSSPVYREKIQIINRKLAERYGDHPALLMWHVPNEYSGECHCDLCQENFRNFVKEKYNHNLDELNHSWWGPFWSHTITDWSQIESPSPIGENAVHGLTLDWNRFVTHQTIDFYKTEIAPLRELTPDIPVTTNFMADNPDLIPFVALDYSQFAKDIDVISWDAYPQWHNDRESTAELASKVAMINDLYRSLKQQPFLLLESTPSAVNWIDYNKAKRPGMHYLSAMQMLAHGSDSNMYFQFRKSRGSSEKFHGAIVDHDRSTDNRVFQDVKKVGKTQEDLAYLAGSPRKADVAILYDWENNWVINDAQSFGQDTVLYPQTVQKHHRAFWEMDIPTDVITIENDFNDYKLLVVPMLYMMNADTISRLEAFVSQGGTLVSTYITGLVDEHDLVYLGGWPEKLKKLFGINPQEIDTLYPADRNAVQFQGHSYEMKHYATIIDLLGAEALGEYEEDFYKATPAITKHAYGEGSAIYIGARLEPAFQSKLYTDLVNELEITPILEVEAAAEVSVQGRHIDELTDLVFIMNFSEVEQPIAIGKEVIDVDTAEVISGEQVLAPYEVKIVKSKRTQ